MCLVSRAYGLDPNRSLLQYVREYWNTESKFPGGAVNAITQTNDGYLWIGTDKGLFRFDGIRVTQCNPADGSRLPWGDSIAASRQRRQPLDWHGLTDW